VCAIACACAGVDRGILTQVMEAPVIQDSVIELALALYEHKWTDLTLGDAEDQIAVSRCRREGGERGWGGR
jgi:hypothetical protein